jgi:hypothetical protein
MPESATLLMVEFLSWIASRRRTYPEAMEAWRSSCPRHTVWEDALAEGLIRFEGGSSLCEYEVLLSPRGRSVLEAGGEHTLSHAAGTESPAGKGRT